MSGWQEPPLLLVHKLLRWVLSNIPLPDHPLFKEVKRPASWGELTLWVFLFVLLLGLFLYLI
jgi:hypothetical protein